MAENTVHRVTDEDVADMLRREHQFALDTRRTVIYGLCAACQAASEGKDEIHDP